MEKYPNVVKIKLTLLQYLLAYYLLLLSGVLYINCPSRTLILLSKVLAIDFNLDGNVSY